MHSLKVYVVYVEGAMLPLDMPKTQNNGPVLFKTILLVQSNYG